MASNKRSDFLSQLAKDDPAYRERERDGAVLSARLYELRNADPWKVPDLVLDFFKEARRLVRLHRQSIGDRTGYDFPGGEPLPEGDVSTAPAEDVMDMVRDHTCDSQTLWQSLSNQPPDVKFTVSWHDAASATSAILREQYLAGVLRGLEFAGRAPKK